MATPLRTAPPDHRDLLPPGSRLGPRWAPLAWQGRTALGLDLGGGSLKLAQVSWGRAGVRLETLAWVPLPMGAVADGVVHRPEEVAAVIRTVLRALGIRQRWATACVGGPAVLVRPLTLPALPPQELQEAMRYEAPQYLPIAADDLVYDFDVLPSQGGAGGQVAVFLAGTHRRVAESHLSACAPAGLRLLALDLDCLCALRALAAAGHAMAAPGSALVVLDCGEEGLGLTIFYEGAPVLNRTIPGGVARLRDAVAAALDLSLPEAQSRLVAEGLLGGAVAAGARHWLEGAAEAVGRSVEFFLIQHRGARLDRVFLTGPWAGLPGLDRSLAAYLLEHVGPQLEDPTALRVQVADLTGLPAVPAVADLLPLAGPALVAAVGAALRGVPKPW